MELFISLVITKAFQLFLVLDPLGNTGIIATLISGFSKEQQRKIILREISIALVLLYLVFFSGSIILQALHISQAAITITGGIIFLLFAISLLFPGSGVVNLKNLTEEPFIVPIATPLIVGPSSLATVILFSHDRASWNVSMSAILLAWMVTGVLIILGPYLLSRLGKNGMLVIERFIGMICALVATKMILTGAKLFITALPHGH